MGRLCLSIGSISETNERIYMKFSIVCLHQELSNEFNFGSYQSNINSTINLQFLRNGSLYSKNVNIKYWAQWDQQISFETSVSMVSKRIQAKLISDAS